MTDLTVKWEKVIKLKHCFFVPITEALPPGSKCPKSVTVKEIEFVYDD
ncbi:hypothetical protein HYU13_01760 [Candidatus Woesearchaeota archaeon]|nr:hypothetical protein [Candidatus Woesearchaeota archaeon]